MSENFQVVMGLIRHVLTFGGGWVAAQGWATQDQTTQISAGVVAIIGVIWSLMQKKKKLPA